MTTYLAERLGLAVEVRRCREETALCRLLTSSVFGILSSELKMMRGQSLIISRTSPHTIWQFNNPYQTIEDASSEHTPMFCISLVRTHTCTLSILPKRTTSNSTVTPQIGGYNAMLERFSCRDWFPEYRSKSRMEASAR